MKSKEEILTETMLSYGQSDIDTMTTLTCAKKAMDIYAAQEVERAKSEVCQWKQPPLCDWHWASCLECEPYQVMDNITFNYCPFCGRKIERI